MTIRDELLTLKGDAELIQAEEVVAWAKAHPESRLHKAIPWDDKYAAEQYRLVVARQLISIHVISEEGTRQWVSLSFDRKREGGGYRDIADVLPVPDLRAMMLHDALAELDRVQSKYDSLKELAEVWAAKDAVKPRRGRKPKEPPEVRPTA